MKLLPKTVATLVANSPELTRVRDGLTAAVQPTLNFLNSYFQPVSDGSLNILRNVSQLGNLIVRGDLSVFGNAIVRATRGNGLVVVPVGTGAAFYVTNPDNSAALFLVNGDGTVFGSGNWATTGGVTANGTLNVSGVTTISNTCNVNALNAAYVNATNINDQAGIIGNAWVGSYNATAAVGYNQLTDTVSTLPLNWRMPRNGSVIAIYYQATQNNASIGACQLYKNGALFSGVVTATTPISTTTGTAIVQFTKGQAPFNAGDILLPATYTSTATNGLMPYHRAFIQVHVEYSA